MSEESDRSPARVTGEVRIRSNVCQNQDAWHLVPGELLPPTTWGSNHIPTKLQQDEKTYYRRCYVCRRTSYMIDHEGCDYQPCRQQGIPSRMEAERRNAEGRDASLPE